MNCWMMFSSTIKSMRKRPDLRKMSSTTTSGPISKNGQQFRLVHPTYKSTSSSGRGQIKTHVVIVDGGRCLNLLLFVRLALLAKRIYTRRHAD